MYIYIYIKLPVIIFKQEMICNKFIFNFFTHASQWEVRSLVYTIQFFKSFGSFFLDGQALLEKKTFWNKYSLNRLDHASMHMTVSEYQEPPQI